MGCKILVGSQNETISLQGEYLCCTQKQITFKFLPIRKIRIENKDDDVAKPRNCLFGLLKLVELLSKYVGTSMSSEGIRGISRCTSFPPVPSMFRVSPRSCAIATTRKYQTAQLLSRYEVAAVRAEPTVQREPPPPLSLNREPNHGYNRRRSWR